MQVSLGGAYSRIKKIIFIIFSNFIVNSEKLDRRIPSRLWEAGFMQAAYKKATAVADRKSQ